MFNTFCTSNFKYSWHTCTKDITSQFTTQKLPDDTLLLLETCVHTHMLACTHKENSISKTKWVENWDLLPRVKVNKVNDISQECLGATRKCFHNHHQTRKLYYMYLVHVRVKLSWLKSQTDIKQYGPDHLILVIKHRTSQIRQTCTIQTASQTSESYTTYTTLYFLMHEVMKQSSQHLLIWCVT